MDFLRSPYFRSNRKKTQAFQHIDTDVQQLLITFKDVHAEVVSRLF